MEMSLENPIEFDEQVAIFTWAKLSEKHDPRLKWLNASMGGVRLPVGLAVKASRSGLKAGIPDIDLPVRAGGYCGLRIELKRLKGGVLSREQVECLLFLKDQGYRAVCRRGAEAAIEEIKQYLGFEEEIDDEALPDSIR